MDYTANRELIFYLGSVIVVGIFVYFVWVRFKEQEQIDLKEHKWIILLYIVMLVLFIIIWRIMFLYFETFTEKTLQKQQIYEEMLNG